MEMDYLKKAIKLAGGQRALAKKLGINQPNINWWIYQSKRVPCEFVIPIEKIVNKQVTRHQLRPDIYPLEDE